MSIREELAVTDDDYENLLEVCEHKCWICGREEATEGRRLAVDHDHRTGAVRGLLCTSCNRRLGATVNPEWLDRAAEYLRVAARAFGDNCETCHKAAPSRLIESDGKHSTFEHRCCRKRWTVGYSTHGIPFAWSLGADPFPPDWEAISATDETIGHPGHPGEKK